MNHRTTDVESVMRWGASLLRVLVRVAVERISDCADVGVVLVLDALDDVVTPSGEGVIDLDGVGLRRFDSGVGDFGLVAFVFAAVAHRLEAVVVSGEHPRHERGGVLHDIEDEEFGELFAIDAAVGLPVLAVLFDHADLHEAGIGVVRADDVGGGFEPHRLAIVLELAEVGRAGREGVELRDTHGDDFGFGVFHVWVRRSSPEMHNASAIFYFGLIADTDVARPQHEGDLRLRTTARLALTGLHVA